VHPYCKNKNAFRVQDNRKAERESIALSPYVLLSSNRTAFMKNKTEQNHTGFAPIIANKQFGWFFWRSCSVLSNNAVTLHR